MQTLREGSALLILCVCVRAHSYLTRMHMNAWYAYDSHVVYTEQEEPKATHTSHTFDINNILGQISRLNDSNERFMFRQKKMFKMNPYHRLSQVEF